MSVWQTIRTLFSGKKAIAGAAIAPQKRRRRKKRNDKTRNDKARNDKTLVQFPAEEVETFFRLVEAHPEYRDPEYLLSAYRDCGLAVIPDPFSAEVVAPIAQALRAGTALSVIRISDGEGNLVSYGVDHGTPELDRFAARAILAKQQDTFNASEDSLVMLRERMLDAISHADVVGIQGLWNSRSEDTRTPRERFQKDPRGYSGGWWGKQCMLELAGRGALAGKTIATTHLYFSVIDHLDELMPLAGKIVIVTNRTTLLDRLRRRYPGRDFELIVVGASAVPGQPLPDSPDFLSAVSAALPADMRGCLCLIGAGFWSKIYCTWVKQRGGVAVCLGSGCDLMAGIVSRPVHKVLGRERMAGYEL